VVWVFLLSLLETCAQVSTVFFFVEVQGAEGARKDDRRRKGGYIYIYIYVHIYRVSEHGLSAISEH
jgi:hypothetical protein